MIGAAAVPDEVMVRPPVQVSPPWKATVSPGWKEAASTLARLCQGLLGLVPLLLSLPAVAST